MRNEFKKKIKVENGRSNFKLCVSISRFTAEITELSAAKINLFSLDQIPGEEMGKSLAKSRDDHHQKSNHNTFKINMPNRLPRAYFFSFQSHF